jgi:hypothetical protein
MSDEKGAEQGSYDLLDEDEALRWKRKGRAEARPFRPQVKPQFPGIASPG